MATPEQEKGSFPSLNILAIITALITGAVLMQQTGFNSTRPTTTEPVTHRFRTPQDVDARLWQDPFAAVAAHREQQLKDATERRFHPAHHDREDVFTHLDDSDLDATDARRVLILPVMTLGGPWADEAEQRRRTRYAVVASLAASGFTADDPSHIGYLDLRNCANEGLPDVLPYEWFSHGQRAFDHPKILILWLDENAFMNAPLRKLSTVVRLVHPDHRAKALCRMGAVRRAKVNGVTPTAPKVEVKILGPATSTVLVALAKDAQRLAKNARHPPAYVSVLRHAHVYPSAPTIAAEAVLQILAERLPGIASESRLMRLFEAAELTLRRTTLTDDMLAAELIAELRRRHVDLADPNTRIAIITEWDTVYAQQLRGAFWRAACATVGDRCYEVQRPPQIDILTYTSGLDGRVPAKQSTPAKSPPAGDTPEKRETRPIERAAGAGQFDYLRRLAAQLEPKEYAAIGVLGSDAYDKLLVLEAIRPRAKEALVFTTDLDARLLHVEEYDWTHNLIVASAFGLRLAPVIQQNTPPFRDTYQTGTFLATRLALQESAIEPLRLRQLLGQPRIFEIGRSGAWDLTPEPPRVIACGLLDECDGVHPPTPWWRTSSEPPGTAIMRWVGALPSWDDRLARALTRAYDFRSDMWRLIVSWVVLIIGAVAGVALLIIISAPVRRHIAWPVKHPVLVASVLAVLAISGTFIYADGLEGEPFALFEGISIWPTELLRLLATLLAVVGIRHLFVRARRANLELTRKYFVDSHSESEAERDAERYLAQQRWRPSLQSARRDIAGWILLRPARDLKEPVNAYHVWAAHLQESSTWARWLRVIPLVAIYIGLGFCLIGLFGRPVVPARGLHALWADLVCILAAVVGVSTLIFMVFDNIRLCDKVASALSAEQETDWPSGLCKQVGKRLGLEVDWLPSLLEVRIIREWTSWLLPMAYYPFAAIAIMMLSRFSLFDNWHQSPGLLLTASLGVMATIASVIMLQRAAQRTRTYSLKRLERELEEARQEFAQARLRAAAASGTFAVTPRQMFLGEQIRRLSGHIREIREIADGAFAPLLRLAPVRALLLPFGGAGGLAFLEYMALWWR